MITFRDQDEVKAVCVHNDKKCIFIVDDFYNYRDIIGCSLTDNTSIEHGLITGTTTTSGISYSPNAFTLSSSTSKSQFQQANSNILRDYTVLINVNSITMPVIRLHVGQNEAIANDIIGLINVIIGKAK